MTAAPTRPRGAAGGLASVTRLTVQQCLRMKVVGAFMVVVALMLVAMPFWTSGDNTLAGRLRSYLSYGLSLLSVAVSVLTIFLSIWVVTEDVRSRQVFSVVVKPLARWQYVLGRWAGVSLLSVGMLVVGAVVIYVMTQYLAGGAVAAPVNVQDELAITTEVFAARRNIHPNEVGDLQQRVAERVAQLKADPAEYAQTLQAFEARTGGDTREAEEALLQELAEDISKGLYSIPGGASAQWTFGGIRHRGRSVSDVGRVVAVDTPQSLLAVKAPSSVLQRAIFDGPIFVKDTYEGRVRAVQDDVVVLAMSPDDMAKPDLQAVRPDEDVVLRVDPTIQLTVKADLGRQTVDGRFSSLWRFENPTTGFQQIRFRHDPEGTPATMTVSARAVDEQGRIRVTFVNRPHRTSGEMITVTILPEDVSVLFPVAGFDGNFARGVLLLATQAMYLAAVGVFAGSFLTFPVACLLSFSMLPFSLAAQFLRDAVDPRFLSEPLVASYYLVRAMTVLLPDFQSTSPSDSMVGGLYLSWAFIGRVALWTVALRSGLLLAAGCVLFSRRELALPQG